MPTGQTYKCANTKGRTTKGKRFFKIPEAKNAHHSEKERSNGYTIWVWAGHKHI